MSYGWHVDLVGSHMDVIRIMTPCHMNSMRIGDRYIIDMLSDQHHLSDSIRESILSNIDLHKPNVGGGEWIVIH